MKYNLKHFYVWCKLNIFMSSEFNHQPLEDRNWVLNFIKNWWCQFWCGRIQAWLDPEAQRLMSSLVFFFPCLGFAFLCWLHTETGFCQLDWRLLLPCSSASESSGEVSKGWKSTFPVLLGTVLGLTLIGLTWVMCPFLSQSLWFRGMKYSHWTFLGHMFTLGAKVGRR